MGPGASKIKSNCELLFKQDRSQDAGEQHCELISCLVGFRFYTFIAFVPVEVDTYYIRGGCTAVVV